jgi:hypothetical protein
LRYRLRHITDINNIWWFLHDIFCKMLKLIGKTWNQYPRLTFHFKRLRSYNSRREKNIIRQFDIRKSPDGKPNICWDSFKMGVKLSKNSSNTSQETIICAFQRTNNPFHLKASATRHKRSTCTINSKKPSVVVLQINF